ncbi:MAG: ATP synthase F1 subunit delta [Planctomycetes bacterium]|nr:ATP synthase F1 subunit delta [Planctomycetota bacterium]
MAVSLATVRYVKALFSVAARRGESEALKAELGRLGDLFAGSPELTAVLRDPRLPAAAKKKVIERAGLDSAPQTLRDFVALCLDQRRPEVILEAPEEYDRLEREARGVVVARVQTVAPLGRDTRISILAQLEEVTGKTIELVEEILPELIGGVRILIGSRMYDGSIRRRLDDIAAHLLSTRLA